jgi:hypothetical protein
MVALGAVAVPAVLAVLFWAFHGSVTSIARGVWASATWKVILIGVVVALVLLAKSRRKLSALVVVLVILAAIPGAFLGGFTRQSALLGSVKTVEHDQPGYDWRLPWATAAASADSRAGDVVGDFDSTDTTFLPASNSYATPVLARGRLVNGFNQVAVQSRTAATATVCSFAAQVPVDQGWFAYNLRRALSFVDPRLMATGSDVWVYCDGKAAKLVIPVTKYVGFPESHRLPAGVLVYDGKTVTHLKSVQAGALPGPVYPQSLAAAQRESTQAADGLGARVFNRAGFETVEGGAANPDDGNVSELLLNRTDKTGWDYVTALTPRGTSKSIAAVSTIAADRVTYGTLNPLTIHKLARSREGNTALSNRVVTAFPVLNWKANSLEIIEVLPTSDGLWTATIANATSATRRVQIKADRSLCLTDLAGTVQRCVDADGATQSASGEPIQAGTGAGGRPIAPSADLTALTNSELADLQARVAAEVTNRLTAEK